MSDDTMRPLRDADSLARIAHMTRDPHPGVAEFVPCALCQIHVIATRAIEESGPVDHWAVLAELQRANPGADIQWINGGVSSGDGGPLADTVQPTAPTPPGEPAHPCSTLCGRIGAPVTVKPNGVCPECGASSPSSPGDRGGGE